MRSILLAFIFTWINCQPDALMLDEEIVEDPITVLEFGDGGLLPDDAGLRVYFSYTGTELPEIDGTHNDEDITVVVENADIPCTGDWDVPPGELCGMATYYPEGGFEPGEHRVQFIFDDYGILDWVTATFEIFAFEWGYSWINEDHYLFKNGGQIWISYSGPMPEVTAWLNGEEVSTNVVHQEGEGCSGDWDTPPGDKCAMVIASFDEWPIGDNELIFRKDVEFVVLEHSIDPGIFDTFVSYRGDGNRTWVTIHENGDMVYAYEHPDQCPYWTYNPYNKSQVLEVVEFSKDRIEYNTAEKNWVATIVDDSLKVKITGLGEYEGEDSEYVLGWKDDSTPCEQTN